MANLEANLDRLTGDAILRAAALRLDRAAKTTIYRAWANYLEGEIISAFAAERAPNGQAWAALKPATVVRKRNRKSSPRSKNKILQDTGTLYDSIYARSDPPSHSKLKHSSTPARYHPETLCCKSMPSTCV